MAEDKKQIISEIKKAKSAKDYDGMLALAQNATKLFPSENKIFGFLHDAQAHYVDEKLHSDVVKQLEEKGDWKTLQAVYQKLLNVFPDSKKLHKLLKKIKKKIRKGQTAEEKAHYLEIKNRILELMKSKKLDDALNACYEVLSHDPEDEEFQALAEKIQSKLDKQVDKDLNTYFKTAVPELKEEYRSDKKAFIRV